MCVLRPEPCSAHKRTEQPGTTIQISEIPQSSLGQGPVLFPCHSSRTWTGLMSLRLLPAFSTDNEDDDDGNFTKWMSSYWGHGAEGGASRKRSFRKNPKTHVDRRASLPTVVRTEEEIILLFMMLSTKTKQPVVVSSSQSHFLVCPKVSVRLD